MNTNLSTQHVKFAKIEQADAWVIVAVLVEERDGKVIVLTEPKVVRIIPKKTEVFLLDAPKVSATVTAAIISPYVSILFNNSVFDITLAPRPPTKK